MGELHNDQSRTFEEPQVDPILKLLTEHCYQKPGEADTKSLLEILRARRSAIGHEIISMRQNPLFFADLLCEYRDHYVENISVVKGRKILLVESKGNRSKKFYGELIGLVIGQMLIQYNDVDDLVKSFSQLQKIAKKHKSELQEATGQAGERIPKDFVKICVALEGKLDSLLVSEVDWFCKAFAASPNFRDMFLRNENPDYKNNYHVRLDTEKSEAMKEYGTFTSIVGRLLAEDTLTDCLHLDDLLVIAELQRLIQYDGITGGKLSPMLAKQFAKLTVLGACCAQIWQYQPWGLIFAHASVVEEKHVFAEKKKLSKTSADIRDALGKGSWDELVDPFLKDLDALYNCPQTKKNTAPRRKAERSLKKIWQKVDLLLRRVGLPQSLKDLLNYPITGTPNFSPPPKVSQKSSTTPQSVIENNPSVVPPTVPSKETSPKSASSADSLKRVRDEAGLEEEEVIAPPKKKAKKRGIADVSKAQRPIREGTPDEADEAPETPIPEHIEVVRRHLPTLQYLFFQEGQTDHSGELSWNSFCQAMANIGFGLTSLGGSEVRFTPPVAWRAESIIIHSPHPERNMSYIHARRAGTRLRNHYNFDADTFVLKRN